MTDVSELKKQLLMLKQEYANRIDKIEDHIHHPQDDLNEHWDDQAVAMRQNEMRKRLLIEAKEEIGYINHALECIETGDYGQCEECGEDIDPKRLEAVPYATLCMQHAP
ncbi:TraR/DksA C4-type zinc finger protein [Psychrobacter sp. HD31]|uniref:TraR/DksA family transcriptional regulator n=1 Tax=Psychrobacter sp. HD31 TaxID=3112003 RepID=UPI003DA3F285